MADPDGRRSGADAPAPDVVLARRALVDQSMADSDQSSADSDQTSADADQTASDADRIDADTDQHASDRDQALADRDRAEHPDMTAADRSAYNRARDEREHASVERLVNQVHRAGTARDRDETATARDGTAEARDAIGRDRGARVAGPTVPSTELEASLMRELEELRAKSAADRARAAVDRARAAADRAKAARERDRLEAELRSAHLDELTGAYRREMGRLALSHEIDRARRSDGRFVVAFVDVDRLKVVNDREGHSAGDRVLQTVVQSIRARLRSFDAIIRYGGDEFVCGLGGTDLEEARRRFDSIGGSIEEDARVGISVGLATLEVGDQVDALIDRADAEMLMVRAARRSDWSNDSPD